MVDLDIHVRTWVRGTDDDERQGLLGYLSVKYGALVVDGITLRRTTEGRLCLSFPERRDGRGRRHSVVRPVDDEARKAIEAAVFAAATLSTAVSS